MGYKKVFTILDNDQKDIIDDLKNEYKNYSFFAIATNDVRNKDRDKKIDFLIKKIKQMEFDDNEKSKIIDLINSKFENKVGLIKSMSTYEINEEYKDSIVQLIDSIKKYFDSDFVEIKQDEKTTIINKSKFDDKKIAWKLLEQWMDDNKIYEHIQEKYKKFEFHFGGGGEISFKKINETEFYVILEQTEGISENHQITMHYHIIVNIKNNIVKLKKKIIISNTLPQSKIEKFISKVWKI